MLTDLWRFMRERFPPLLCLPLAALLWLAAPWHRHGGELPGTLAVFCALLALRMADDINSLAQDRRTKPQRSLCRGEIGVTHLRIWIGVLLLAAAWLLFNPPGIFPGGALRQRLADGFTMLTLAPPNLYRPAESSPFWAQPEPWLLALGISGYAAYFLCKKRLPVLLRPFVSNVAFMLLPLFAAGPFLTTGLLLGLFCWFGAVGHEFAHNVRTAQERVAAVDADYVDLLGSRGVLLLAASLYLLALGCAGLLSWAGLSRGVFIWFVCTPALWLAVLFARLWQRPGLQRAASFYVAGFVFFLLPLLIDTGFDYLFQLM